MSDELLSELENMNEDISSNVEHTYKKLAEAILALLALVGVGGLGFYYTVLFNALVSELDKFKTELMAYVDKAFEDYWNMGVKSANASLSELGATALVGMGGLDKSAVHDYIMTVTSGTAIRLQEQLKANLQRALLQGADNEQDVRLILSQLSTIAGNEATVRFAKLTITSQLVAASSMAQRSIVDAVLETHPELVNQLTKTWHWSHVQRPNHAMMDGVTIPYTEKFSVPGTGSVPSAEMVGPHDPTAPIGQTANCMCWMSVQGKKGVH